MSTAIEVNFLNVVNIPKSRRVSKKDDKVQVATSGVRDRA